MHGHEFSERILSKKKYMSALNIVKRPLDYKNVVVKLETAERKTSEYTKILTPKKRVKFIGFERANIIRFEFYFRTTSQTLKSFKIAPYSFVVPTKLLFQILVLGRLLLVEFSNGQDITLIEFELTLNSIKHGHTIYLHLKNLLCDQADQIKTKQQENVIDYSRKIVAKYPINREKGLSKYILLLSSVENVYHNYFAASVDNLSISSLTQATITTFIYC